MFSLYFILTFFRKFSIKIFIKRPILIFFVEYARTFGYAFVQSILFIFFYNFLFEVYITKKKYWHLGGKNYLLTHTVLSLSITFYLILLFLNVFISVLKSSLLLTIISRLLVSFFLCFVLFSFVIFHFHFSFFYLSTM